MVPDYELVFLMEMAIARNQEYLEAFQADLQAQRYGLIVSGPLTTTLQGAAHSFGEENDAWVRKVAKPILCYYEPVLKLKDPALMLLAPGGLLFTFSCSGGIGAELFDQIVAGAAIDAGVDGAIVQRLEAACDHPTTLLFPEGEYLKGLVVLKAA